MAARFSVVAFHVTAFAADKFTGPCSQRGKGDPVLLVGLLHAGGLEILQDHLGERLLGSVFGLVFLQGVDQFVVLIHAEHAMRAKALHGEGTGNADLLVIGIGLVAEVFKLCLGGDGLVDLLLAGDAGLTPVGVPFLRRIRPLGIGLSGNLPFLPPLPERRVKLLAQRLQLRLPLLPYDVDLSVVGD